MVDEELNSEQALTQRGTDLLDEAQALNELSKRNKELEAINAELLVAKKKYYDSILNGQPVEEVAPYRTRDEIKKELFGIEDKDTLTNLRYAELAVELDDACIREEGESCFLPKGSKISPTADEMNTATKFHQALVECIEEADGDDDMFNRALAKRIKKK